MCVSAEILQNNNNNNNIIITIFDYIHDIVYGAREPFVEEYMQFPHLNVMKGFQTKCWLEVLLNKYFFFSWLTQSVV